MSSNINDYVRPTDNSSRRDINKILSIIHDLTAQEPEEEALQQRICFTPEVKLRTTEVTFGAIDELASTPRDIENFIYVKKRPTLTIAYDLIHTEVGAGALTFPTDSTIRGALCKADGTNYITIDDDDDDLDPTTELTIAANLNLPASGGGFVLFEKANQYRVRVVDTNTLEFAIYSSGAYKTALTYTYTPSTTFNMVATYKSTSSGQTLYINGSSSDSDAETGAIATSSNKLGIFATADGTNIALVNTSIAWFALLSTESDSAWVTNYNNHIYDTSDSNTEITSIAFVGDTRPTPNAEEAFCKSP